MIGLSKPARRSANITLPMLLNKGSKNAGSEVCRPTLKNPIAKITFFINTVTINSPLDNIGG